MNYRKLLAQWSMLTPQIRTLGTDYAYHLESIAIWLTAQQSVHLTALRRGLAASIFINVILLAVLLVSIGGR